MNPIKALYTAVSIFTGEYERDGFRKRAEEEHKAKADEINKLYLDLKDIIPEPLVTDMFKHIMAVREQIPLEQIQNELRTGLVFFMNDFPKYAEETPLFSIPFISTLKDLEPILNFIAGLKLAGEARPLATAFSAAERSAIEGVKEGYLVEGSTEWVRTLYKGTVLEGVLDSKIPVGIPEKLRFEGTWVLAPRGRGKTTLLSVLLERDLELVKEGKASVILMDSKGDLINYARRLKRFAPGGDLHGKLVLIEPTPDLALNPMDLGVSADETVSLVEYILHGLSETDTTPKQGGVMRRTLLGMRNIPGANLITLQEFLENWKRPEFEKHVLSLPPDDAAFFLSGKYDEAEFKKTRGEIWWRIDGLLTKVPIMRHMFKAPKTGIKMAEEMDAGKVIIIDNSKDKLKGGTEFYSRFFIALVQAAGEARAERPAEDKLPCFFYIDECDVVISREKNVAEMLHRLRSQKIALILAHQKLSQIESLDVQGALLDSSIKLVNVESDAGIIAERMRLPKEQLSSLNRGQFALYLWEPRTSLIVTVDDNAVSSWPLMTDAEFKDIQAQMREKYSYSPPAAANAAAPGAAPTEKRPTMGDDTAPEKWGE